MPKQVSVSEVECSILPVPMGVFGNFISNILNQMSRCKFSNCYIKYSNFLKSINLFIYRKKGKIIIFN